MSLFAVIRGAGLGWTEGKGAFDQSLVSEHTAFMNSLAENGFVLFAGPLAGSEHDRIRVLLIMEAASEADINRLLAEDPWARTQRLVITSIEAWNLFLGVDRLRGVQRKTSN